MLEIREVKKDEISQVAKFLVQTMAEVYPFPVSERSMRDVYEMEQLYITRDDAVFLAAYSLDTVVGTIAFQRYIDRFPLFVNRYDVNITCEITKCYVSSEKRQQGIGSLLWDEAVRYAKHVGYEMMYLHTHRFLPGGLPFWSKKGFRIIVEEEAYETVHMEKRV